MTPTGQRRDRESGFSLVELLVVMIIIGLLAAIAIPTFLSQRRKAVDAATRDDLSSLSKEVLGYYIDGREQLVFSQTGQRVTAVASGKTEVESLVSKDTVLGTPGFVYTSPASWCIALTNPSGGAKTFRYTYSGGMSAGTC